jgi:hypothetical protein
MVTRRLAAPGWRGGVRAGAVLAACLVIVLAGGVATAGPAVAEPTIRVQVGADGRFRRANPLPVVVSVTADRAFRGTVQVSARGQQPGAVAPTEIPLELAAGSTKDLVVVVPDLSGSGRNGASREIEVVVDLSDGDVAVAHASERATWEEGVENVGVMPSLDPGRLPDDIALRFGATGRATLIPVDVDRAGGAGAGALGPFASIVAAPADLTGLNAGARAALLEWGAAGGQLYVDADDGPVAGLPEEWQPRNGIAVAGDGLVRLSHGRAAVGDWSSFLDPTRGAWAYPEYGSSGYYYNGNSSVSGTLGADAGLSIPQLGALTTLAVVYVLLIGPVNFIVLARMRRRQLAWLTIPALSVLFTGMFVAVGSRGRAEVHTAHATVIELGPGGARARSSTLVGSSGGGHVEVAMPGEWRPAFAFTNMGGPGGAPAGAALTVEGGTTASRLELAPGEFREVTATGPLPGYGTPLRVQATGHGDQVTGTVTNGLDVALHQVTVMVHNSTVVVGTVAAHSQQPFTLTGALGSMSTSGPGGGSQAPEVELWPSTNGYGGGPSAVYSSSSPASCLGWCAPAVSAPPRVSGGGDAVNPPAWTTYTTTRSLPLRRPGVVNVVGWTNELPSPLTQTGGMPITHGRTALVARSSIDVAPDASFDPAALRFEQVRGTSMKDLDTAVDPVEPFVIGHVYRLVLPPGTDPASVVVEPPQQYHRLAIGTARGWKVTPEQGMPIRYRLAPEDVIDGVVYLQIRLPEFLTTGDHNDPYLGWRFVAAAPGDAVAPARLASEER